MMEIFILIEELDDALSGLEDAVGKRDKELVGSHVVEFSRIISEAPRVLEEHDLTTYGNRFQQIMKQGGYLTG
mgnify:CR=1 FL=1